MSTNTLVVVVVFLKAFFGVPHGGWGGGVLPISSDGVDQRIFGGGLKFFIPGFVGKLENLASIFLGGLI